MCYCEKLTSECQIYFFKLVENGVFVWLPNVVEKVRGCSNYRGYETLLEIEDRGTRPKKFEKRCFNNWNGAATRSTSK